MFQAKLTPTAAGRALLAKAQQGAVMEFTGVRIGSGSLGSRDPDTLTNVITPVKTCPITSVSRQNEKTYVKFVLTQDNTSAYYLREMALMAKDPDSGEIAYMYANDGQNAELIPVPGATAFEREITVIVILSNVETVTASIQSGAYAGKEEFDEHVNDNVRHITAAERETWNKKVGLGSDGKIPSSYLPAQGTPSLEDLNGTLSVKNGGTGKTSWAQNRILYASGTGTLGQLAFPGTAGSILRQDKSGAPYWTAIDDMAGEIGAAKIVTGSYTGALSSGESDQAIGVFSTLDLLKRNGRKIVLPQVPKMLYIGEANHVIYSADSGTANKSMPPYLLMNGNSVYHNPYFSNGGMRPGYIAHLEGSTLYVGNTGQYLNSYHAYHGLNVSGKTYNWILIA